MAAQVEGQVLGELADIGEVSLFAGFFHLLKSGVGTTDVGCVVLGVVQLHDAS